MCGRVGPALRLFDIGGERTKENECHWGEIEGKVGSFVGISPLFRVNRNHQGKLPSPYTTSSRVPTPLAFKLAFTLFQSQCKNTYGLEDFILSMVHSMAHFTSNECS